jgi:hypothetical protein
MFAHASEGGIGRRLRGQEHFRSGPEWILRASLLCLGASGTPRQEVAAGAIKSYYAATRTG